MNALEEAENNKDLEFNEEVLTKLIN